MENVIQTVSSTFLLQIEKNGTKGKIVGKVWTYNFSSFTAA